MLKKPGEARPLTMVARRGDGLIHLQTLAPDLARMILSLERCVA